MIYRDIDNNIIEEYDLSLGYLKDYRWEEHQEIQEQGHYEYINGIMNYVIDKPFKPAYLELVEQQYIPYTETELLHLAHQNYSARLDMLEYAQKDAELLSAQIEALSDRNEFIEDCIAEMAEQVYA